MSACDAHAHHDAYLWPSAMKQMCVRGLVELGVGVECLPCVARLKLGNPIQLDLPRLVQKLNAGVLGVDVLTLVVPMGCNIQVGAESCEAPCFSLFVFLKEGAVFIYENCNPANDN